MTSAEENPYLREPILDSIDKVEDDNRYFKYAHCGVQGHRKAYEDKYLALIDAQNLLSNDRKDESLNFFAIYDGHWGDDCAKFVSKNLYKNVVGEIRNRLNGSITKLLDASARSIFQAAFEKTDMEFKPKAENGLTGSTACFVTVVTHEDTKYTDIFCANIGDSRCVLFDHGRVAPMSFDHKPYTRKEKQRILQAGGTVEHGRVNGDLALARAFGDFDYKANEKLPQTQQQVICIPDMIRLSLPPSKERRFLLIACDGVWDVLDSEQAAKFVNERLNEGMHLDEIVKELVIHCSKDLHCLDNISAIIVEIHPN